VLTGLATAEAGCRRALPEQATDGRGLVATTAPALVPGLPDAIEPGRDDSIDAPASFREKAGVRVAEVARPTGDQSSEYAGIVTSIGPPDSSGWRTVSLATGAAFNVSAPAPELIPLRVGDRVAVDLQTRRVARSWVSDAVIRDSTGALVLATCESGAVDLVPGWTVGLLAPIPDGGDPRHEDVLLQHVGVQARLPYGVWRELVAPEGSFWVAGGALRWVGPPPPDAFSAMTWEIVRVR
jgi:hypothetical protein